MNVWIVVMSALFSPLSPVLEPFGLVPAAYQPQPAVLASHRSDLDQVRYHGLERLLAELKARDAQSSSDSAQNR